MCGSWAMAVIVRNRVGASGVYVDHDCYISFLAVTTQFPLTHLLKHLRKYTFDVHFNKILEINSKFNVKINFYGPNHSS